MIPAGGRGKITLKIDTTGTRGRVIRKALIESNDPETPRTFVKVILFVKPVISVEPDRVFLRGFKDEDMKQDVLIRANKKDPLVLELQTRPRYVMCKLVKEDDLCYRLTVVSKNRVPGNYRERLVFKTNYRARPFIAVPVLCRILSELSVVPKEVLFKKIRKKRVYKTEESMHRISRDVFIRLNKGDDLRILSIEMDKKEFFKIEIKEFIKGKAYRISLIPQVSNMPEGKLHSMLIVHTNNAKYPIIKIPVFAEIK